LPRRRRVHPRLLLQRRHRLPPRRDVLRAALLDGPPRRGRPPPVPPPRRPRLAGAGALELVNDPARTGAVHGAAPVRIFPRVCRSPRIPAPGTWRFFIAPASGSDADAMSSQPTYLTPEGLQKLKDELQRARTVERQQI